MKPSLEGVSSKVRFDQNVNSTPLTNRVGARLLIVDDEITQRNMLAVMVEQAGVACKTVPSAEEALKLLRAESFDAVIADLVMPGFSGMELLTEVHAQFPRMVFIMATGIDDARLGVEAMRRGADDYLVKPLQMEVVMVSLDRAFREKNLEQELEHYRLNLEEMVCKRTVQLQSALSQIEQSYNDTLESLGAAIDMRDGQTAGHSRRGALYSIEILSRMHGTPRQLKSLAMGAWLHDIGKLGVPDAILLKPGRLTDEERHIIQGHVLTGYNLVKTIPFLADAAEIILTHHERWNGSGYPQGLKGHQIPFNSRIFAVVDAFDALTSDRPYRSAVPFEEAREEIERSAGIYFDPQIAAVFLGIPRNTWDAIREQTAMIQITAVLAGISPEDPGRPAGFEKVHAR